MTTEMFRMFVEAIDSEDFDRLSVLTIDEPQISDSIEVVNLFQRAIDIPNYTILNMLLKKLPSRIFVTRLCAFEQLDLLQYCVESDTDFKRKILNGYYRALHTCAKYNSAKMFEYLIRLGADVNEAIMINLNTPLHVACQYTNIEMVKLICDMRDIQINKINMAKESALHVTCKNEQNLEIVKVLINASIDISLIDEAGDTAFDKACAAEANDIVAHLLTEIV